MAGADAQAAQHAPPQPATPDGLNRPSPVAAPKPKPDPLIRPYEADRHLTLLIGRAKEIGTSALAASRSTRSAVLLMAAENVGTYLDEILQIVDQTPIDWETHRTELISLGEVVGEMDGALAASGSAMSERLAGFGRITSRAPKGALNVPKAPQPVGPQTAPPSRTDDDNVELAHQSIAVALTKLRPLPSFDPAQDFRAQAVAFCRPLREHLLVAGDATRSVQDRRTRHRLKPDVELLSSASDELAEMLSMRPKLPWDVSFASLFDAENLLRRDLGLIPRTRPYSGRVDPARALEELEKIKDGKASDVRTLTYTEPAAAVQAIVIALEESVEKQHRAVEELASDLAVKDDASPSLVDRLLQVAVNVAISAAAGGLGAAAVRFFSSRFDKLVVGLYVKPDAMAQLSEAARKDVTSGLLEQHALGRAIVGDMLKDGTKELFKSIAAIARAKPVSPSKKELRLNFAEAHKDKLTEGKLGMRLALNALKPALEQADLETLNAYAHTCVDVFEAAKGIQYDASMREWLNLKALIDAGAAPMRHGKQTPRDADIRDDHVRGAIDISLTYSGRGDVAVKEMRLYGSEPAARAHLRRMAMPIGKTDLHQRFDLRLVGDAFEEKVVFGKAPDRGILIESLTSREWAILRVVAEHDRPNSVNVSRAVHGGYGQTSDRAVIRALEGIIQLASGYSTARLED